MRSLICALGVLAVVLTSCSSGKSTFERGDYYEAVLISVNRLRKNPDHKKSVETLRQAYPLAISWFESNANTALTSGKTFRWTEVVNAYTAINHMYDEINRCPGALRVVPNPVNYFDKLQEARNNAAEEYYSAGILALQANSRESAKQAYYHFQKCNNMVEGYKEVHDYLAAALDAATVKVLVEPVPVHTKATGVSAQFFNDKISEFVHSANINQFVRFYSRAEAATLELEPDHIVELTFDDFTVGQVYKHEKEIHLTKDSVELGQYVTATTPSQTTSDTRSNLAPSGRDLLNTGGTTRPTSSTDASAKAQADREAEEAIASAREAERLAREAEAKARAEREAADRARREAEAKAQAEKEAAQKAAQESVAQAEAQRLAAEKAAREAEAQRQAAEKAAREAEERARAAERQAREAEARAQAAEKAAQEAAAKAPAGDEDPTILPGDTVNVKDPVTICHIPPGNKGNRRTLTIDRAALQAHLNHGDVLGACEGTKGKENNGNENKGSGNKNDSENAKDSQNKSNPGGQQNPGKGAGESKGKGKGVTLMRSNPLYYDVNTLLASAEAGAFIAVSSDTNKIYGTVKATLYHYTKTTTARGVLSFRIVDARTGALLSAEKMPGEFVWKSEWATFNGDERALSPQQLALTRQKEQPAPESQELFIAFTQPIYGQITRKIAEFYKGY